MSGLGYSVPEPIRDDESALSPFDIVTCETCGGHKTISHERADHTIVTRVCPTCRGAEQVLRGNPPGDRFEWSLEFTAGGTD